MEGRKESVVSRRRPVAVGVLTLVLLGTMLAIVSTSSGGTGTTQASAQKPAAVISTGRGFGEVYAAKASTLRRTLFKAKLLPKNKMSRNIALAGLGRADRKVNEALALGAGRTTAARPGRVASSPSRISSSSARTSTARCRRWSSSSRR